MLKKILTLLFIGSMVLLGDGYGEATESTLKLDLKTAYQLAYKNNEDLKIAKFNKEIADEKLNEAWGSGVFPDIKGSVNYRRALRKGVITFDTPFFSGQFPIGTDNTMTASVSVDQPLFTGALFIAIRVARTYTEIAGKIYDASKSELMVNVQRAFYSYLLSREVVNLSKQNLTLAENNLKDTEVMWNAGIVTEYDLVRAKVQVQNLIPEVEQAENTLQLSENLLKLITGIDNSQKIVVNDSLSYQEFSLQELDDYTIRLFNSNHVLKQLELEEKLRDDVVSARFAMHFPSLYAFGSWQAEAQENDNRAFNNWRYTNSSNIGLNLKIPIFNGLQTTSQVQQAKLDFKIASENYSKTKKALRNQLQESLLNIKNNQSKISAYKLSIEQAQLA
ncbi:MAG TPA: TolC family protein, partial [Ignavibacteriaceae bacterium]|nr:TolC family protein [Ignavibacteriaceae bacterium]